MKRLTFQAALLGLLSLSLLPAQETRSVIFGHVTDPQNSSIPGASVAVANIDTNTVVTLTTNDTGYYEANFLLPGNYRVTTTMSGFKKSVHSGIELSLNARAEIDVHLELGEAAETLSVNAEAPLIDASSISRQPRSGLALDPPFQE